MYLTSLPDHTAPEFDEAAYFSKFKQHNIIVNAVNSDSYCDDHTGCLSIKTVFSGAEWYGIDNRRLALRPAQYLVLNNHQHYSCHIEEGEKVKCLSVFFQQAFASAVLHDILSTEDVLLEDPFFNNGASPEFYQTLNPVTSSLQARFFSLISNIESRGYDPSMTDEHLVFLLRYMLQSHRSELIQVHHVNAIKVSTRHEIYKRLCIARDVLHSSYAEEPDLHTLSRQACLSVPQLIRQFKSAFHTTPYQYLINIRLSHAAALLQKTDMPVQEITWICGFKNASAFCRAFRASYGMQPLMYRKTKQI